MAIYDDILFEQRGSLGLITLNRPDVLNVLNLRMYLALIDQLGLWGQSDSIQAVAIRGAGSRAFCAGGDLRSLYDAGQAGSPDIMQLFWDEYRFNTLLREYPKPYIALIDGITMGGGVGVSVHGSHRIVGDHTLFAMPETGIGLIPDVGGTYFLPRMRGELGIYLGLTGARLKAADCLYAGLATHYVPSQKQDDLVSALSEGGDIDQICSGFSGELEAAPLARLQIKIDEYFCGTKVEEILGALNGSEDQWAQEVAHSLYAKSPTSLKITLRQLQAGAALSFRDCMALEYRIITRIMKQHDFFEGVRAIVIDKDHLPCWNPSRLEDVSNESVHQYFESLGVDEWNIDN